jgi:hypothetical protein
VASEIFNKSADWKGAFHQALARAAITAGANPVAVKQRLPLHGIDPSGL